MRGESSPIVVMLRRALAGSNLEITVVELPLGQAAPAAEPLTALVLLVNRSETRFSEIVKLFTHPAYGAIRRFLTDLSAGGPSSRYVVLATEGDLTAVIDSHLPAEAFAKLERLPPDLRLGQISYDSQHGAWEASGRGPA